MIFDAHAHVHDPVASHVASLDEAGIDRSILLVTRVHPERAADLAALRAELESLARRLAGEAAPPAAWRPALSELDAALASHPARFVGLGPAPLTLPAAELGPWLEREVVARGLRGLGELTPPPGAFHLLAPVLEAATALGPLPVMVHGFAPTTRDDLRVLASLARRFPAVPVIVSQLGGLAWLDAVEAALATPNLYLEISTVPVVFAARHAISSLPERTLFGSDAPYGDPLLARRLIERVTTRGEVRARVLGGTAARLFGLE